MPHPNTFTNTPTTHKLLILFYPLFWPFDFQIDFFKQMNLDIKYRVIVDKYKQCLFNKDKIIKNICSRMVKKNIRKGQSDTIINIKQHLRHSSNQLERHIFNKNTPTIRQLLAQNIIIQNISYQTHNQYIDLIREINKEHQHKQMRKEEGDSNIDKSDSQSIDSHQQRRNIHRQQSLQSSFQQLLDKSNTSYQKTYQVFKGQSLLKKYGHLVGKQWEGECGSESGSQLSEEQRKALRKIKALYKRYRVSNMYKCSLYSKISKGYVQILIRKGCLKEWMIKDEQVILSLIS